MFEKLLDRLAPNRHKHMYKKIGFSQVYGIHSRYSIRHYKCACGKQVEVDGRNDYIEKSGKVIY